MTKLRIIVTQLSEQDYQSLHAALADGSAPKSAELLRLLREEKIGDRKILQQLQMSQSAYYTLCSRLGTRIERHMLGQLEHTRTALLRQVAGLHEIVFSASRRVAITTLKKLEKELKRYDLANELVSVYGHLRRLSLNKADHDTYDACYKEQRARANAFAQSEEILMKYFNAYERYYLYPSADDKAQLALLRAELQGLMKSYDSHRLYIHHAALTIFDRLYLEEAPAESTDLDPLPTEGIFEQVAKHFACYADDPIYPHYVLLFDFLRIAYYDRYHLHRGVDHLYEALSSHVTSLLSHYAKISFPSHIFWIMLRYHVHNGSIGRLAKINTEIFEYYVPEVGDTAGFLSYVSYRALCCHYEGSHSSAITWIRQAWHQISMRSHPVAQAELKALLALQYMLVEDHDQFQQLTSSLKRQLRQLSEKVAHLSLFTKIIRTACQEHSKSKEKHLLRLTQELSEARVLGFSPIKHLCLDKSLYTCLAGVRFVHS